MSFIAMIIALVLLQIRSPGDQLFHDQWLVRIDSIFRNFGLSANASLLLSILVPVVVLALVLDVLQSTLFGLLWIAATATVLLYSFGRGDFAAMLDRYRAYCRSENLESAWLDAQADLDYVPDAPGPASTEEFLQQLQGRLLYEGYQRWFAVLFYFVIFGPGGALAYRLLQLAKFPQRSELAVRLLFYADWVPLRLLAATFSLTGDFLRSRDQLLAGFGSDAEPGDAILLATARAASGMDRPTESGAQLSSGDQGELQLSQLGSLLSRSAISWLIVISVLVVLM